MTSTRPVFHSRTAVPGSPVLNADQADGMGGKLGFALVSVYAFLLLSRAVEFIDTTGKLHLMVLIGVPTTVLALVSGKIFRGLGTRIGLLLCLMTGWMVLALPFSIWRGGSVSGFTGGWAKSLITFLLISGFLGSVRQLRQFVFVLAWAASGMVFIIDAHSFRGSDARLAAGWGTLGNANDLATVLLIALPFCIHVATDKRRLMVVRIWFLLVALICMLTALKTGSRGAFVAIFLLGIFLFIKAAPSHKVVIAAVFIVLIGSLPFLLTPELKARYMTILQSGNADQAAAAADDANVKSALQSTEARRDLLKHAIELSAHHPVFGVGYGQFPVADANRATSEGQEAYWHEVHNIFAVILVENGILALVLFCWAFFLATRVAARNYNRTRKDPAQNEIARFSLCLLTALIIYFLCNNFATDAYGFQFPLLGGMATALELISRNQIHIAVGSQPAMPTPNWPARVPRRLRGEPAFPLNSAGARI